MEEGLYAVHGRRPEDPREGALFELQRGEIGVFRGSPRPEEEERIGPVYTLPDGAPAVPTGRIFVRFAEGTSPEERREEIAKTGYEIEQIPGYAPHTAWLRSRTGDIAAALQGIPGLRELPGVEHVEPQMLMESAKRQG